VATRRRVSVNKINLLLDIGIGVAFVIEEDIHWTGIFNHQMLGLAFGAALIVHLVLHWKWVVTITRKFFKNFYHTSRVRYVLNVAIFVDMLIATISGILISRNLLSIPMSLQAFLVWGRLHFITSEFALILIGLHVIIHWKWILVTIRRYLFPWLRLPVRISTFISHLQAK
jgi:hypothetical protein